MISTSEELLDNVDNEICDVKMESEDEQKVNNEMEVESDSYLKEGEYKQTCYDSDCNLKGESFAEEVEEEIIFYEAQLEMEEDSVMNHTFGCEEEENDKEEALQEFKAESNQNSTRTMTNTKSAEKSQQATKRTNKKLKIQEETKSTGASKKKSTGKGLSVKEIIDEFIPISSETYKSLLFGITEDSPEVLRYDQIPITDSNLLDHYLKDYVCMKIEEKKKVNKAARVSSGQKNGYSVVPPLPSEVLRKYTRRLYESVSIRKKKIKFSLRRFIFRLKGKKGFYYYRILCPYLQIDDKYVAGENDLPYQKLRELLSIKNLIELFPNITTWVDLLKKMNFPVPMTNK